METQKPDANRDSSMVRLERREPFALFVPTLDAQPNLKPDEAFQFQQRNREVLCLILVMAVIWVMAALLNSSYREIESLNNTIAEKEKVIATLPTAETVIEKLRQELKAKELPQQQKPEEKKPVKVRKGKRKLTGYNQLITGGDGPAAAKY